MSFRLFKVICWKILACFCFATTNNLTRYLTVHCQGCIPPLQVICLQYLFALLFFILWFVVSKKEFQIKNPKLLFFRGVSLTFGLICWVYTLTKFPIYIAGPLALIGPIATATGAKIFLNEKLTPMKIMAIILASVGAFVVVNHSSGEINQEFSITLLLFPFFGTLAFACSTLLGRAIAVKKESSHILTLSMLFFTVPITIIPTYFSWVELQTEQILIIALLGLLVLFGQFCISKALQKGEALFLAPIGSTKCIFMVTQACIFFSEVPSKNFYIGTPIILAALFFLSADKFYQEKKKMRLLSKKI